MLKIAIENSYTWTYKGKDEYWAKFFMQEFFFAHGIELVRVSINHFSSKRKSFDEYAIFDAHGKAKTIKKEFIPDIIRSRRWAFVTYKYDVLQDFSTVPSQKISTMSNDKFEIYKFAYKHQPLSCLLSTFFAKASLQEQFSDKILLKPIRANWGKWIVLTTPQDIIWKKDEYIWLEELFIVQEFKDFSKWYPWICTWIHDIRLMFAWKKIIETTLRTPKTWDFRSNIWSWWQQVPLPWDSLPKELLSLARKIYRSMNLSGNDIMSMDFSYCNPEKKRYLLEINASPGTRYYQTDKQKLSEICKWLVNFFTSLAKKQCIS